MLEQSKELPKILIIDDDPKEIQTAHRLLDKKQFNLFSTTDAMEGLKLARKIKPHLVLLDYGMPEISGPELCEKFKYDSMLAKIPIVFVTYYKKDKYLSKAFNVGAVDFINKPLNEGELLVRIQNALAQSFQIEGLGYSNNLISKQLESEKVLTRVICHDMANSLSVVKFATGKMLRLIDKYNLDDYESVAETVAEIVKGSQNMQDILEHVRMMKSVEDNKRKIVLKSVDLISVIENSIATFENKLVKKKIEVNSNYKEFNKINIVAEPTALLNSVLNNIISNAIKFSFEKSRILMNVSKQNGGVTLITEDFGIGMGQKLLNEIFEQYTHTTRRGTGGEQGIGFGMPLAKFYMEIFDGSINVDSTSIEDNSDCHGTKFTLQFKLAA